MNKEDFKEGARFKVRNDGNTIYTVIPVTPSRPGTLILKSRKKALEAIVNRIEDTGVTVVIPVMNQYPEIFIPFTEIELVKIK